MQKITRKVRELQSNERRVYEAVLGEPLREDQLVVIQVINLTQPPGRDGTGEQAAGNLPDWCNVYEGLSDDEIAEVEDIPLRRSDLSRPS